ncbi:DNA-directed RNA polymerase III subunit RPC9-like [Clavelina lepadiformis]|uniref:DNA-directed RNA polymerase III subunit RPC9-like n=1 Tax=Clavelina lepadiformis TaxID=159417 RepID=UPI004041A30E
MEITKSTSAMLSNYEVLKVLNDYAAEQKENKRNDQNLSTITYETLKYLNETPAGLQNEEIIPEVVKALSSFGLTKAEKLQLINLRPTTAVEISLIVEESEERISENQIEEILRIISQLPALEEEEEEENEEEQQE